jgi:putative lipoprotein
VELPIPPAPPGTGEETVTVTGVVTYAQRIALTPEAVVTVDLRDVTRPDTDAPPLARQIIDKPGQVPIPFSLTCAKASIEPGRTYAVSARITDRGQLQFVTDTRVPVLSSGLPGPIEIIVVPVR